MNPPTSALLPARVRHVAPDAGQNAGEAERPVGAESVWVRVRVEAERARDDRGRGDLAAAVDPDLGGTAT
jgi:hypothetical protein